MASRPSRTLYLVMCLMGYIPLCCKPEFLHAHEIFLAARRTAIGNGGSGVTIAISTTATGYGRGFRASGICFCGLLGCLFSKTFLDKQEWTRARIGQKQWFKDTVVVPKGRICGRKVMISKN